ncbi:hypothetical protein [Streptomyces dubilierae]|uniref:Serine/threonine protein kinase n=1 Tax=Streptomyces dubilierae TaxID=3075533 RepID=A0ABU2PAB3_9ACTN|nr:hypothetical protein [Streptomyces sp. DSM 41921]MDT0389098.1 hypothetical protein [Streptomyces sp. DSM 41921]
MGKSASREDRGKRSSFSVSYEGGGRRDPSAQVKLGRLSYKGPATAMVAVTVVAVLGVVGYLWLDGRGTPSGAGAGPGTSVTPSTSATAGPGTASATAGSTAPPAPVASGPSASQPGAAAPAADTDAGGVAVREHRKVVLRSAGSLDLDFTNRFSDIASSMSQNDGWSITGDNGDLSTVEGPATAGSCAAATDFGFTIDRKNIRKGLTACVLTDENRVASLTVLGWQTDDNGLSSVTMDVTTWENSEAQ